MTLKCKECDQLKLIRVKLEDEVQDLTASVFEEANKMVQKAHGQTVTAQKQITAANEEVDKRHFFYLF